MFPNLERKDKLFENRHCHLRELGVWCLAKYTNLNELNQNSVHLHNHLNHINEFNAWEETSPGFVLLRY